MRDFKAYRSISRLAAGAILLTAASAQANDGDKEIESLANNDWFTVGVGPFVAPTYSGSDKTEVSVGGAFMGRVAGYRVSPRVAGAAVDFIRDDDKSTNFNLGPVVRVRFDRTSRHLKDPVVESLGKLDTAVELGVAAGVGFNGVLNPYDRTELNVDVRWDVASAHKGMVVSPSVSYLTPLSRGAAAAVQVGADYVDRKFSSYYWTVTPAQSTVSGLPVYRGSSGFNSVSAIVATMIDLDGNLLNGGFAVTVGGGYQRLVGSADNTPITRLRGDPDQLFGGVGLSYTFF